MLKFGFKAGALLLGVGLFLAAVIAGGRLALDGLRQEGRYTLAFADVACDPPPGLGRADFLDEVQYLAGLPPRLRLLDEGLAARLADGFARHPWVARVEKVEVLPPSAVRVRLVYRTPALVVRQDGQDRVVDAEGVLLPRTAPCEGLPIYRGEAPPPAGPVGTPWGDPGVEEAARKALAPASGGRQSPDPG